MTNTEKENGEMNRQSQRIIIIFVQLRIGGGGEGGLRIPSLPPFFSSSSLLLLVQLYMLS